MLVLYAYNSWILAFISSWKKDEQRGRRKKDEQREKWMRPSCLLPPASAAASLAAAPATSGVGYLCLAIPSGGQSYRYHDYCCTPYSTVAAIARTSTLPWSAGSTEDLSTSVPDVVALGSVISVRVCLVSPVGISACVICPASQ